MFKKFLLAIMIPASTLLASCSTIPSMECLSSTVSDDARQSISSIAEIEIERTIFAVAVDNAIDPKAFVKMARIESNLDPNAHHPQSKACGLFQLIPKTAKLYKLADCRNPRANAEAAAKLWRDNAAFLQKTLGRTPTAGELYLAHQQGAASAAALLANPGMLATAVVGRKGVLMNGGHEEMTAADFANLWVAKFRGL